MGHGGGRKNSQTGTNDSHFVSVNLGRFESCEVIWILAMWCKNRIAGMDQGLTNNFPKVLCIDNIRRSVEREASRMRVARRVRTFNLETTRWIQ